MERGYARPSAAYFVMAAGTGDIEAVKLFLEAGSPAIVTAATSNHPEVVIQLIKAGADVNAVDDVNCTALNATLTTGPDSIAADRA